MTSRLAIIDGIRTPFCKAGTDLKSLTAQDLGRVVVTELIERTGLDVGLVSQTIFGNVSQPADAVNIARLIALNAGIPQSAPAYTVQRNCASGFEAVTSAYEKTMAGQGDVFMVGGTESMSNIPLFYPSSAADKFARVNRGRSALARASAMLSFRPSDFHPRIGVLLGLTDASCGLNMGETAEVLYRDYGISRESQDTFALQSHLRATAARDKLRDEIMTVYLPTGKFVSADNGVRENQTMEALAKLKPVFAKHNGTVTAGNASQITDGAVALLVMDESRAEKLGLEPLGFLRAYAYAGVDPQRMGLGPAYAIPMALKRAKLKWDDIQLIEINEAFAVQVLAVEHVLKTEHDISLNRDLLNVNGGAIALGHPVGASGARLVLTLLKEMKRRNLKRGLASACVGGGQGAALILER
jgi:acetyl-CoA C-acetyltransferase/acetyl-CoA acyltransferase